MLDKIFFHANFCFSNVIMSYDISDNFFMSYYYGN